MYGKTSNVNIGGILKVIEKDDSHFIIEKTKVVANIDKEKMQLTLQEGRTGKYRLDYSLKTSKISLQKDGVEAEPTERRIDEIFKNIKNDEIFNAISTENNRKMFNVAYDVLSCRNAERNCKMSRMLLRLINCMPLQILSVYGLNEASIKNLARDNSFIKSKKTTPYDILNMPKYLLHSVKQYDMLIDRYNISKLITLSNNIDSNNVKLIMKLFYEENNLSSMLSCIDELIILIKTYNYTNVPRLITYLTRDIKLNQGISSPSEGASLLKDYINMSKAMQHSYEKYPDSLKKAHDVCTMNYRVCKSEIKEKAFAVSITNLNYSSLAYENSKDEYKIIIPKTAKDVIMEGTSLSHCVASYVDDIIKDKCMIVFMRLKEKEEECLITIEVKNGEIKQARGKCNRPPSTKELEFILKWAEDKALSTSSFRLKVA